MQRNINMRNGKPKKDTEMLILSNGTHVQLDSLDLTCTVPKAPLELVHFFLPIFFKNNGISILIQFLFGKAHFMFLVRPPRSRKTY